MTPLSRNARVAGLLYLVASAVGVLRLIVIPGRLFVTGDAAVTAGNIAAHEGLFRLGIVSYVLSAALWLFVPLALYRLLHMVDRELAVLMVILGSLVQVPLFLVNSVTDAGALLFVRGTDVASAFSQPHREAFASILLDLHHHLDLVNAVFWGLWLFPFGILVYRSRFLPRIIGVWLILAGCGWLSYSMAGLLSPGLDDVVNTYIQPLTLGEVVAMFWLLVVGAREHPGTPRVDMSVRS